MDARRSGSAQPAWKSLSGPVRVMREFRHLSRAIEKGTAGQLYDLELVDDDVCVWRFKLHNFDDGVPGGRQLNADLAELKARHGGVDHLLMEARFPPDYPISPFFLRVIAPRCHYYTGHVTAGGSICLEALTLSGSPSSWQPEYSFESVLQIVVANMQDCESVVVRTATGPGGVSGPLRIDLQRRWHHCQPTAPYSEAEARAAFDRAARGHGWANGRQQQQQQGGMLSRGQQRPSAAHTAAATAAAAAARARFAVTHAPAAAADGGGVGGGQGPSVQTRVWYRSWQQQQPSGDAALAGGSSGVGGPSGLTPSRRTKRPWAALAAASVGPTVVDLTDGALGPAAAVGRGSGAGGGSNAAGGGSGSGTRAVRGGGWVAAANKHHHHQQQPGGHRHGAAAAEPAGPATAAAPIGSSSASETDVIDLTDDGGGCARPPATAAAAAGGGLVAKAGGVRATTLSGGCRTSSAGRPQAAVASAGLTQRKDPTKRLRDNGAGSRRGNASSAAAAADVEIVSVKCQQLGGISRQLAGGSSSGLFPTGRPARGATRDEDEDQLRRDFDKPCRRDEERLRRKLREAHERLERLQREKAQAEEAAAAAVAAAAGNSSHHHPHHKGQLLAPLPAHWDAMKAEEAGTVKIVRLPLPAGGDGHPPSQEDADEATAKPRYVDELIANGLSRQDAVAALVACGNDVAAAIAYQLQTGGSARALKRERERSLAAARGVVGEESAEDLQRKLLEEEAATVIKSFTDSMSGGHAASRMHGGGSGLQVVRVERVQNWRHWTKYTIRKGEVQDELGPGEQALERGLWHGTPSRSAILSIVREGFDPRISSLNGALGAGTYFAGSAAYSDNYSSGQQGLVRGANPVMAAAGGAGAAILGGPYGPYGGAYMQAYGLATAMARRSSVQARLKARYAVQVASGPAAVQDGDAADGGGHEWPGTRAMLMCRVTLGRIGMAGGGARRPPPGFHSVSSTGAQQVSRSDIFCVFDGMQAYPEYIVHYNV